MSFNIGDAIASIKATRDSKIERDYQDSLNDIQEKYTGAIDVEGGVQKGGAVLLGVTGATKGVKDLWTKYKQKVQDFKDKVKEMKEGKKGEGKESDEADNDADNDDVEADTTDPPQEDMDRAFGTDAEQNEPTDWLDGVIENQTTEVEQPTGIGEFSIEENPFDVGGGDLLQGVKDFGGAVKDRVMQVVRQQQEPQVGETELAPADGEIPETELGAGRVPSTQPSGRGSGDIELTERGTDNQPSTETDDADFTGTGEAEEAVDSTANAVADTTDAVTDVASSAGEVAAGATDAVATAAEVGGLEGAGAALDATGIGAPIGAILGILGLVVGTATTIGSAVAEGVSTGDEQSDTKDAQGAEETALANPPDYAGKFASNVRTSVAGFL